MLDLINSERGIFCLLLVGIATVFVIVGAMTVAQWTEFMQVLGVTLVGSKTVTGVAELVTKKPNSTPSSTPVISVRDHGAKGDGATDDTPAIMSAVTAAAAAGGGAVTFPPGTYKTTPKP